MCLALHGPKELGHFHSVARSGQESIAQGLPWETRPEGATGISGRGSWTPRQRAPLQGLSPASNGAKLRNVWDAFRPAREL
jgi:hypothetical protein